MNCRNIEPLFSADRDGALTAAQRASLQEHLATCPACRQLRQRLGETMTALRTNVANVSVPDTAEEWQALRVRIEREKAAPKRRKILAPVLWYAAPLAAAAAVAIAFFVNRPSPVVNDVTSPAEVASAEFVEAGDAEASTMVYVDKDSGWLVVWATDAKGEASG